MSQYKIKVFDDIYIITNKHIERSVTLSILLGNSNVNDELIFKLPAQFKNRVTKNIMQTIFDLVYLTEPINDITKNKEKSKDISLLEETITYNFILNNIDNYDIITEIMHMMRCKGIVDKFRTIFHNTLVESINDEQYGCVILQEFIIKPELFDQFNFKIKHNIFTQLIETNEIKYDGLSDTFYKLLDRVNNNDIGKWITIPFLHKMYTSKYKSNNIIIDIPTLINRFNKYSYGVINDLFIQFIRNTNNIYIAGGFLIGCMKDCVKDCSDIDLWVYGESDSDIIQKTIMLLTRLYHTFRILGYNKILWSMGRNVITIYCAEYKRNIQIIMNDKIPQNSVNDFDVDVMRAFTNGNKLECTIGCLLSNRDNIIKDITLSTNPHRIVKMLLKGYDVSKPLIIKLIKDAQNNPDNDRSKHDALINKLNNILSLIDMYQSINNTSQNVIVDKTKKTSVSRTKLDELNHIITIIANKYYYPTNNEVDIFINGSEIDRLQSRATYIIKQICGHNIIECDIVSFIEKVKNNYNSNHNTNFFSLHYDNTGVTDAIEGLNFIPDIDESTIIDIKLFDPKNFRLDIVPVKFGGPNSFVNPSYMRNETHASYVYIRTDFIKLEGYPMTRYREPYHRSRRDRSLYNIRIYNIGESTNILFDVMSRLDDHLSQNNNIALRTIDDDKQQSYIIVKRSVYHPIVRNPNDVEIDSDSDSDSDSDDDDYKRKRSRKIPKKQVRNRDRRYIVFKHYNIEIDENFHDEYKIATPIYKNNQLVPINSPADLAEHIKIGSEVQFEFLIDMMIQRSVDKHIFPRLRLTRLIVR
jgi:hypothetical protein